MLQSIKKLFTSREKRITVSKIILFLPYAFLIYFTWLFTLMLTPMIAKDEYNYQVIQYYGLEVLIPILSLCAIAQTTYSIKAKAEYLAHVMVYNIYRMIDIQKAYPEYKIYDTTEIKKDAANATQPYEEQLNMMNKTAIAETPSSKI